MERKKVVHPGPATQRKLRGERSARIMLPSADCLSSKLEVFQQQTSQPLILVSLSRRLQPAAGMMLKEFIGAVDFDAVDTKRVCTLRYQQQ
jgi:hypothetical protein